MLLIEPYNLLIDIIIAYLLADYEFFVQLNHDIRQSVSELNMAQIRAYNKEQVKFAFKELREIDSPSAKDCYTAVSLKGPFRYAHFFVKNHQIL